MKFKWVTVNRGLYLAGGGARGAYQAGVLRALSDILGVTQIPFSMISGVSVGSINAAVLVENADNFKAGCEKLEALWSEIHIHQIFNASNFALGQSVWRNLTNTFVKHKQSGYLLDTTPLRKFIKKAIDFKRVEANINNHQLTTMEVLSNCYEAQRTISFYQTNDTEFVDWKHPRHSSQRTILKMEHILASSALPLFFPTVDIEGLHYGDGGMGLVSPLRGAIRFKMDKVLIIGTRKIPEFVEEVKPDNGEIGFARTLGRMLNNAFLDNLDRDIEMVKRMNEIAHLVSIWKKRRSPWHPIETLHLRPSGDIGAKAQLHYNSMPALLRMLLNSLGAKSHSGDLLSFLLFEQEFTREIISMGYSDTINNREEVEKFFAD